MSKNTQEMELSKKEQKELLSGMAEMLLPAFHKKTIRMTGRDLIVTHKVVKDNKGNEIKPNKTYKTNQFEKGEPVNHERAMKKIIADAKDKQAVENGLAEYLVKFGRRPERTGEIII